MTEADLQLVFEASGIKELIAQTTKLNAQMERLIQEGNRAEKEMGGLGKAIGGVSGILATAGIAIGAAEVFNLGKAALQSAINYETLGVQFEVFLGSAEKATQVLAQLNQFSIETPFTPDEVNASGRALLGLGVAVEDLIPNLKTIGNLAAGVGIPFQELAVAFGKAMGAGIVQNDILNQFQDRGINVLKELGDMYGKTALQVKKMGEQNLISSEDFKKALENMSGEGGKFAGMMDKMSKSTEGLISTLVGDLENAMRDVGTVMLIPVRAAIDFYNENKTLVTSIIKATAIVGAAALAWKAYGLIVAAMPAIMAAANAATITIQAAYIALTGSMNIAAGAMKAFQIVMSSNPWGLALTGIVALTAALVAFSGETKELTAYQKTQIAGEKALATAISETNSIIGKETANLEVLVRGIRDETKSKDEKRKLTDQLLSQYGGYLTALDQESVKAGNVEKAYVKIKDAIIQTIVARQKGEAIEKLFTEQIAIQRDAAAKAAIAWKTNADEVLRNVETFRALSPAIQEAVAQGRGFEIIDSKTLNDAQRKAVSMFADVARAQQKASEMGKSSPVADQILRIVESTDLMNQGMTQINSKFGEFEKSLNSAATPAIKEAAKAVKELGFGFIGMAEGHILQAAMDSLQIEKERANALAATKKEAEDLAYVMSESANLPDPFLTPIAQVNEFRKKIEELAATMKEKLGGAAFSEMMNGLGNLKKAFLDFGASAATAMGQAIGMGRSVGAAFHKVFKEMLVMVPQIAGMALIQAAAAPDVPSFLMRLALLGGGLALLGLSGIIQGSQQKNQEKRDARWAQMDAATGGVNGRSNPQGLGDAATQMQPIQIDFILDGQSMGRAMYPHLAKERVKRG